MSDGELQTVRLCEVPVELRVRSLQHGEELVREMTLLRMTGDIESRVPERLCELADEVMEQYGPQIAAAREETDRAVAAGLEVIPELVYRLPAGAAAVVERMAQLLDEADEFCRAGEHLLTLETPPDVAEYRRWSFGEVQRQLAGEGPRPWRYRRRPRW
jgi:hypothetical protein